MSHILPWFLSILCRGSGYHTTGLGQVLCTRYSTWPLWSTSTKTFHKIPASYYSRIPSDTTRKPWNGLFSLRPLLQSHNRSPATSPTEQTTVLVNSLHSFIDHKEIKKQSFPVSYATNRYLQHCLSIISMFSCLELLMISWTKINEMVNHLGLGTNI